MTDTPDDVARTLGLNAGGRHKFRRWVLGAAAVLAVAVMAYWAFGPNAETPIQYETTKVARADLTITVSATGTVEPTNLVEISSELSGTLEAVNVDFNDVVEEGTVLATLDTTKLRAQLDVSRASVSSAKARVAIAQVSLNEAQELFRSAQELDTRGVITHEAFISRKAIFERAQAELASARAEQELAEATLQMHQAELDRACICSPISGVVLDRTVDPGQIVAASLSAPVLFTLAEDLSKMELQVDIDEADIGRVAVGNAAQFTVDAYDDRRFPAKITEIRFAPETIDGVVTYKAVLNIDNSDMLLRPGMTATADITVDFIEDALVVPNAALRYAPPTEAEGGERSGLLGMLIPEAPPQARVTDSRSVWVLREDAPAQVAVRTGPSDGNLTQIVEGALDVGDSVITDQSDG
ncbi:MAG: efflux RND transporter periplasmic adaptor subunit [Alphaproteobacteria bacterium]|nr:efflux RND transporter periplasmic adaptor subunit [Alphaproteobacteria bacterium]NNF72717.1 efflux RND transporter periplasmic adaptor subunit [Paracoccaceae bacterium]